MNKYQEFSEKSFLRIFVNHNFQVDFRDSSINSFRCKTDVITGRRATEATIDFFHAPSQLVIAALREKKGGGGLPTTVKSGEIGDSSYIYYAGTDTMPWERRIVGGRRQKSEFNTFGQFISSC